MSAAAKWLVIPAGTIGVYTAALGSAQPFDVLLGAILGVLVAARTHPPLAARAWARRLVWVPWVLVGSLIEVATATATMAAIVLGLQAGRRPGLLEVPFGERTDSGVIATAHLVSLSPGSVLVRIDRARRVLVIHAVDASDPDAFRRRVERFYHRYQRRVFP